MSDKKKIITFKIFRKKVGKPPYLETFDMEVKLDEYLLDVIERIWAFKDRSLVFTHACHHSTCGACGMRVNGTEKLTCITPIKDVAVDRAVVKIEPLRNFPIISDLAVDMGVMYFNMERVGHQPVVEISKEPARSGTVLGGLSQEEMSRLSDCIECGMCISACPVVTTNPEYLGPAVLAGAQQRGIDRNDKLLSLVDSANGVWRCHSTYECTEVCPSYVDPGRKIMQLRQSVVSSRLLNFFK